MPSLAEALQAYFRERKLKVSGSPA
jgi:hypothetical protein